MIDDIHIGIQSVSIGGYKNITPKKVFSKWFNDPNRTIVMAEELSPEPSIAEIEGKAGEVETYDPLEKKTLFRIFSDLQADIDGIIGFANQYGFLGEGFSTKQFSGEHVEPISIWTAHINKMKDAVNLWDHIQQKDGKWLSNWLGEKNQPHTTAKIYFEDDTSKVSIHSKSHKKTVFKDSMSRYTEIKARFNLMKLINDELAGRVTTKLIPKEDSFSPRNIITANNLIGFMWLQLSLSIEGNLKYKKCVVCSELFRLDHRGRGKPPRFCSNACKSKDYRNRKKNKIS